ncbi:MAG: site-2 protease family protein [Winogradskyella sp.]|uniref:site-2 protease family protein n=1 Tax=Winogradskyella sp. TaxID=1883156 RepID=UPI0017B3CAE3|nr:site-2 protease family protein [Winogradskyella sp.]MBT8245976.1 site-2 protease family protein [Winogradskyella sp.]NNK22507.1 site-2 protease family protein [Winogradskyella sp.]
MKANLNLGSVSGIKIKVHWTFIFIILWVVFAELKQGGNTQSVLYNVAFILVVFVCVILHELGHALTAKQFGINTKKITLLPIGGLASLDKIPESPRQELIVTIAGPLVNVAIALLLYFFIQFENYSNLNLDEAFIVLKKLTLQNFIFYLFVVNIGLVIFNVIPAFPMDGGRVLRALLSLRMNRVKATKIAASIGQFIAAFFLLFGLLYNPFLVFIALFIFLGAYGENQMVQHMALLKDHNVKDAMLTNITTLQPETTLDDILKLIISGTETNFIVTKDDAVLGIVYHKTIIEYSSNRNKLAKDIMETDFKTLNTSDNLKSTYASIMGKKQMFFPVLENEKLIGAIDHTNLNEFIMLQTKLVY